MDKDWDVIESLINTNIDEKRISWPKFAELISNQFEHGGSKYAHTKDKEWTDVICEFVPGETGVDWILGTMLKYLGRYKNFQREKDLLKIATFAFICWVKKGYHLKETHDEDTKR